MRSSDAARLLRREVSGRGRGECRPTLSIHWPERSRPYVCGLFAFHIARPSVVIAKQPTLTLLRTSHGATATAAPATTSAGDDGGRARARQSPGEVDARTGRDEHEPRVPEHREPADDAEQRARRRVGRSATSERQQHERRGAELVDDLAVDVDVVPDEIRVQRRDGGRSESRRAARATRRPISKTSQAVATATTICARPIDHQLAPNSQ